MLAREELQNGASLGARSPRTGTERHPELEVILVSQCSPWGSPLCFSQHHHFSLDQETILAAKIRQAESRAWGHDLSFPPHLLSSSAPHCLQQVRQCKPRALLTEVLEKPPCPLPLVSQGHFITPLWLTTFSQGM